MNYLSRRIILLIIGILFVASGLLKVIDSQSFAQLISQYGFGWAGYFAPILSSIEVIIGLMLILDIKVKTTVLVAGCLTLIFTVLYTYAFFVKGVKDCGCMGKLIELPPFVSFFRNIMIMVGSYFLWKLEPKQTSSFSWKYGTICIVGGLCLILAGYTLIKPITDGNKVDVGESIQNNFLRFYAPMLSGERSFVFIFSPDCGHCWNVTENVKSIKALPEFQKIIAVTYPDSDLNGYMQHMRPNFEVNKYPTKEIYDVIESVPVLLMIENGKITKIYKNNDIPCGAMLKASLLK